MTRATTQASRCNFIEILPAGCAPEAASIISLPRHSSLQRIRRRFGPERYLGKRHSATRSRFKSLIWQIEDPVSLEVCWREYRQLARMPVSDPKIPKDRSGSDQRWSWPPVLRFSSWTNCRPARTVAPAKEPPWECLSIPSPCSCRRSTRPVHTACDPGRYRTG